MSSSAPLKTSPRRTVSASQVPTICVVDPQTDDYRGWEALARTNGAQLQIVPSAEAALRLAHRQAVDLWVVNTELPGLTGFELCGMLKSRAASVPVYLVADHYTAAAECEALRQRATLFGVKPAHREWLNHWRQGTPHGAAHCAPRRNNLPL